MRLQHIAAFLLAICLFARIRLVPAYQQICTSYTLPLLEQRCLAEQAFRSRWHPMIVILQLAHAHTANAPNLCVSSIMAVADH